MLIGTFAWQAFSQMALNESSHIITNEFNKGGRLHDDYDGLNKDVYVENYADSDGGEDIFARVRLDEYFEYGQGAGTQDGTEAIVLRGDIRNVNTPLFLDNTTWDTYMWGAKAEDNQETIRTYRDMQFGGSKIYMPTFNKNFNSLDSDINGTYAGTDGDRTTDYDRYGDYKEYLLGQQSDATPVEMADPDDEYGYIMDQVRVHEAKNTLNANIISMEEWNDMGQPVDNYWVYDLDGWAYWAAPIKPQTATGLLVDEVLINKEYDGEWYYGINVVNENATETGWLSFFETANNQVITDNGIDLLKLVMGVELEDDLGEHEEIEPNIQAEITFYDTTKEINNVLTISQGLSSYTASVKETGDLSLSSGVTYSLLNSEGKEISSSGVIISFNSFSENQMELQNTSKISMYNFYLSTYGMVGNYTVVATSKANPNCSSELKLRIISSDMENDESGLESITSVFGESVALDIKSKVGTDDYIWIDGLPYYVLDNQIIENYDGNNYIEGEYEGVLLWAATHVMLPESISMVSGNKWRSHFNGIDNFESRWSLSYMKNTVLNEWLEEQSDLSLVAINTQLYTEGSYSSGTATESSGSWKDFTYCKAFLFSITEFNDVYDLKGSVKAKKTGDSYYYWLRSSIAIQLAMLVNGNTGYVEQTGAGNTETYGVRPAIWVVL